MRHVRMLGLCLVAVFAVAAVMATAASAASPEWGQCYAKEGGKYANSNCTEKAKKGAGTYEWRKGVNVSEEQKKFVGGGGAGVLKGEYIFCFNPENRKEIKGECPAGYEKEVLFGEAISVECTSERNAGEASGSNGIANVSVTFRGCKLLGSVPCQNTSVEEEVRVNSLKGKLGYLSKGKKEVGVLLEPSKKKGTFATFGCLGGLITTVVGEGSSKEGYAYPATKGGNDGILSPITPVDTMSTAFTQEYTINENLENVPSKFETGKEYKLESYVFNAEEPQYQSTWSKAGESITNVNEQVSGEPVEIKA